MNKSLPLAPYGLKLKNLLAIGKKPKNNIWVFVGANAWRKAEAFSKSQLVLCLPYGAEPQEYVWPVDGCHPLVIDTGGDFEADTIRKLAYLLLISGAVAVHVILFDRRLIIYRRKKELTQ